jgi:hypothetical protein
MKTTTEKEVKELLKEIDKLRKQNEIRGNIIKSLQNNVIVLMEEIENYHNNQRNWLCRLLRL